LQASGPLENTGFQQRINLSANYPHELSRIGSGQDVLIFKWAIFPPFTTKIITIQSDINIYKEPRGSEAEDLNPYLKPQPLIESDHEIIRALAGRLKAGSVQETIQKTFDWVSERIDYTGYIKRARGALYAAKYIKGDCAEFAYLFVALCRANGIPARVVRGFVCSNNAVLDLGDYHEWAEFHHKGHWQVADP
jgi:transglutaminase-like putative cysteine protease